MGYIWQAFSDGKAACTYIHVLHSSCACGCDLQELSETRTRSLRTMEAML